jgi:hypothetical protein
MIEEVFDADSSVMDAIAPPEDAYNASRRLYHATVLLDRLARHKRPEWDRLLGMTDVDRIRAGCWGSHATPSCEASRYGPVRYRRAIRDPAAAACGRRSDAEARFGGGMRVPEISF